MCADTDNSGPGIQELLTGYSLLSFHTFTDMQVLPWEYCFSFLIVGLCCKGGGCFGDEDLIEMLQVFSQKENCANQEIT